MTTKDWIHGLRLADDGQGATPKEEIMLFPYGTFEHSKHGKMVFDDAFFDTVIENYNGDVLETKPFIDAEHDVGKALAWLDTAPYKVEGKGLYIKPNYTDLGRKTLGSQEYRYFSPWYENFKDAKGKVHPDVLRGGAATNIPFLKLMPSIVEEGVAANEERSTVSVMLSELSIHDGTGSEGGKAGQPSQRTGKEGDGIKETSMTKELMEALGLAEGATEEEALEKVKGLSETAGKVADIQKELDGLKEKHALSEADKTKKLTETKTESEKKLAEMQDEINGLKVDKVIGGALEEHKIRATDEDKDFWTKKFLSDPAGTIETLEHLAPIVPLGENGAQGSGAEEDESVADKIVKLAEVKEAKFKMTFSDAMDAVQKENPAMAQQYMVEVRNRGK